MGIHKLVIMSVLLNEMLELSVMVSNSNKLNLIASISVVK